MSISTLGPAWGVTSSATAPSTRSTSESRTLTGASAPGSTNPKLTASDRELVYQATGVRLDGEARTMPKFADQLAADRAEGKLKPGEPVSTDYLAKLLEWYSTPPADDPVAATQTRNALDYLESRGGQPGIDLLA